MTYPFKNKSKIKNKNKKEEEDKQKPLKKDLYSTISSQ